MTNRLLKLGFAERFLQEATMFPDCFLGRVIAQYKDLYKVATNKSEVIAEISGKLLYFSLGLSEYPAVGDFVMIDRIQIREGTNPNEQTTIQRNHHKYPTTNKTNPFI